MREFDPIGIFLDANVLISACLSVHSRFRNLWRMRAVRVMTSAYAVTEARRHLSNAQLHSLQTLLLNTRVYSEETLGSFPFSIDLVTKDRPILMAALETNADYLLTGDKRHFGHLLETRIQNTLVCLPASFLAREAHRILGDPLT